MAIYRLTPKPDADIVYKQFTLKKGIGKAVFVSCVPATIADAQTNPNIYVKQVTAVPAGFTATAI